MAGTTLAVLSCGTPDAAEPPVPALGVAAAVLPTEERCELQGTWALRIELPVEWKSTPAIDAGRGDLVQYARVGRTRNASGGLDDVIQPCGVIVPATHTTSRLRTIIDEHILLDFDSDMFEARRAHIQPSLTVTHFPGGTAPGAEFASDWASIQLGIALNDPENDPWPCDLDALRDVGVVIDADGPRKGVPTTPREGEVEGLPHPFSRPLVGLPKSRGSLVSTERASKLWLAIRNVERISGRVHDCDTLSGSAVVKGADTPDSAHFINSAVLHCTLDTGRGPENCSDPQVKFLNAVWPKMKSRDEGRMSMVRIDDALTCRQIRELDYRNGAYGEAR